ncbi:hypothetical protein BVG18_00430 [Acinetobacter lwoffii]|uniref:hypothetical protein n=1 Tax=Acinetobacter lwoffii TaxID=28090 RepID=UPI000A32233C|nr:hypothetical protein BVG18_00430 [Acinetobacter lwoffii]
MNLIEELGGFEKAKKYLARMEMEGLLMGSCQTENGRASFYDFTLRSALADHDRTDTCTDIRNHISPNTKVIEK